MPAADEAFHIETHGIDHIPVSERWASARDVGGMWAGASVQIEYFIYGAILMTFGFTFAQALSLIVIGNVSYLLLGLCSLQGPQSGTTVFAINRASYGPNGSRAIAFFNWITQMGFEVEGIILIMGAALVLTLKAGFHPGNPAKVVFVVLAVAIQSVLPFLGHATIVKTLRWLSLPFLALFAVLLGFAVPHATVHGVHHGAGWQVYMVGLAFTITLAGLGWVENGNDYTRYCKPTTSKWSIVGWVFVGTAVPEILVMSLGATVGTFLGKVGETANAFLPFAHQSYIPAWFVDVFLMFAIVQLFAINSLDLYSSGVTLQALGVHVKRYYAVVIDCAIVLVVAIVAVFNTSFDTYLTDFVDIVIVWIAPWAGIFLTDWIIRRYRYMPGELHKTGPGSLYYGTGGVSWPAAVAQLVGMFAAISALTATFHLPTWLNELTNAIRDATGSPSDFSVFLGFGVGGLVYLVLGYRTVRRQADRQDELLSGINLLARSKGPAPGAVDGLRA